jgi:hypothetical protein
MKFKSLLAGRSISVFLIVLSYTIKAQNVTITDPNFKNALIQAGIDFNKDGIIQVSEAQACDSLNLSAKNIADLSGIAFFTSLTYLNCAENKLEALDISQNKNLIKMECQSNMMTSLTLGSNKNLFTLLCHTNQLKAINVSACQNLGYFFCSRNQLEHLDISKNIRLQEFNCQFNSLKQICVSEKQRYQDWVKDNTANWVTTCVNSLKPIKNRNSEAEMIGIYDMMGRKVAEENLREGIYIYLYDDGTYLKRWNNSEK